MPRFNKFAMLAKINPEIAPVKSAGAIIPPVPPAEIVVTVATTLMKIKKMKNINTKIKLSLK